jgi:hypothetical protein
MPIVARRTSDRVLAAEALRLRPWLEDPGRRPATWSEPAFAREVALVRAHLAPIRSPAGLEASFAREAFHTGHAPDVDDSAVAGPVRVAYAIRWLELGEDRPAAR